MHECSKEKISLDLYASLSNGKLYTDPHIKATDCGWYLKCTSSHPGHTVSDLAGSK